MAHAAPPDKEDAAPARDAPEGNVRDRETPPPGTARPDPASRHERQLAAIQRSIDAIKPLPPTPIPDDPPPHEGAVYELLYVIEAPDLIIVEVLEALPGRPITGEHLVRTDGSISLDYYGDVHVQGLTRQQAKVKIIHHLRRFISEEVLGLYVHGPEDEDVNPPARLEAPDARDDKPEAELAPEAPGARPIAQRVEADSPRRAAQGRQPRRAPDRHDRRPRRRARPGDQPPQRRQGAHAPDEFLPKEKIIDGERFFRIDPADSSAVFVDVASYNSKYYYVDGDLALSGRYPSTGRDTVLDAIKAAGGFMPTADRRNVRLVRPARAGKPARVFPIDIDAIVTKGDRRANLQVFPGDRLIVGRDPVVKNTIAVDRISAQVHSALTSMQLSSIVARSLFPTDSHIVARIQIGGVTWTLQAADRAPELTPAQREAAVKAWVEFWSKAAARGDGDEPLLREALMRHLNPIPPTPAPPNGPR